MRMRTAIKSLAFLPSFTSQHLAESIELEHVWDADVYTVSGYDNLDGHDPICWLAPAFDGNDQPNATAAGNNRRGRRVLAAASDLDIKHDVGEYDFDTGVFKGKVWENSLVPDFLAGHTRTLPSCPHGLELKISAPLEHTNGEVLRIDTPYRFEVDGVIHMDELRAEYGLSDDAFLYSSSGTPQIAVQILFCPTAGEFCTPFVFSKIKSKMEKEGDASVAKELIPVESQLVLMDFSNTTEMDIIVHFEKEVTVTRADTYIPLGHFEIFLTNGTKNGKEPTDDDVVLKLDVGRELHEGVLRFQSPPKINSVHLGVEIFSYILIVTAGSFLAAMIAFGVKHREHSVMKLSQGKIMIACVGAALVSTVSSFLFNPKSDAYCKAYGPLIMIPLQIMLSILIARLYRIICVVSPLINWNRGLDKKGRKKERARKRKLLPSWLNTGSKSNSSSQSGNSDSNASGHSSGSDGGDGPMVRRFGITGQRASIRTKFSEKKLWYLAFVITLPQVIAQLVGLIKYPQTLHYVFNDDESEGRVQCINDDFDNMHYIEYALIFLSAFILVFQCQKTKSLPSLFDEAESISSAVLLTIFMLAVGIAVIAASSEPTSSADVRYLMMVAIVLSLTVNLSYRLLYPKLKIIRSGEEVAIHHMVSEHKNKSIHSSERSPGVRSSLMSYGDSEFSESTENLSLSGVLKRHKWSSALSEISSVETGKLDENKDGASSVETGKSDENKDDASSVETGKPDENKDSASALSAPESASKLGVVASENKMEAEEKEEESVSEEMPMPYDMPMPSSKAVKNDDSASEDLWVNESNHEITMEDAAHKSAFKDANTSEEFHGSAHRRGRVRRRNRVSFCINNKEEDKRGKEAAKSKIIIHQNYIPPKKVTLAIMQQNEILDRIHHAVLSGMVVSTDDWEELKEKTLEFSSLFQERIEFGWQSGENAA